MSASPTTSRPAPTYDVGEGRRRRQSRRRAVKARRRWAAGAALALDAALVLVFGAGYVARSVPPPTAWPVQVAALVLPPASALVAAAAVGWVAWAAYARTRWATAGAVLHLGLAALTVVRYGPGLVPDGAPGPAADGALRVLTLNSGRDEPAAVALAADLAGHLRPDLVALQETWVRIVDDGDDFRIGGRRAALGFLSDPDYRLAAGSEENLVLLARGGVAVEPDVGGDLDPFGLEGSGGVRRFVAEWGGRPFAVYVVHFRSYSRPGGSPQLRTLRSDLAARAREARYLRDVLDAEALPYLVVGDFNATPDQWTYAHVASGLQDALRETAGWAPTYPDGRPLVQIDAVLTSPGWAVASARVLPPGLSDHRGVLVDLRPPPGGDARE